MAVAGSVPGVFPANVALLALDAFKKDFPYIAACLDAMRSDAMMRGDGAAGSLRDGGAGGAPFSVHPHGNHGDNQTTPTDKAVL